MEKTEIVKLLSEYESLKKRVEKLLEGSKKWEVKNNFEKKLKRLKIPQKNLGQLEKIIKIASKTKLTPKHKKQLVQITRRRLLILAKHFSSIYEILKKNPDLFSDKKIATSQENLKEKLSFYEKIVPVLFEKRD
jgi:hypothetical protein